MTEEQWYKLDTFTAEQYAARSTDPAKNWPTFTPPTGTADEQRGAPAEATPGARDSQTTKDER